MARAAELARRAPKPTEPRQIDWNSGEGVWLLETRLRRLGVPEAYLGAEWEKVRARSALNQYVQMLPGYVAQGRSLLLLGPVGTGKSSAASLVAREAVKHGLSALWQYVPDLMGDLHDRTKREHLVKASARVDLLIWDDFLVQDPAEWELGWLDRIVENRYARRRPMVVTTNATRETLRDRRYERLVDRWRQRGFVVTLGGESQRGSK